MAKSKKAIIALVLTFLCLLPALPVYADTTEAEETPVLGYKYGAVINYQITDGSGSTGWFTTAHDESASLPLILDAVPAYDEFYAAIGEKIDYPIYSGLTYHYEVYMSAYDGDTFINLPTIIPSPLYAYISDSEPSEIANDIKSSYGDSFTEFKTPFEMSSLFQFAFDASYQATTSEAGGALGVKYSFTPDANVSPGIDMLWVYVPIGGRVTVPTMVTFDLSLSKITYNATGDEITREQLTDIYNELKDINASDDENAEKVVEAIENLPDKMAEKDQEEAEKANDDVAGITDQFKDFEYSIDFNDIKNVYSSFWNALSSTSIRTSFTIEGFEFKGHTLWTTQTVDFGQWINHPLVSVLLSFIQIIISIKLIVWVVEFWYVLIQFFVGNWDGSMGDILYKYNPFT